MNGRLLWLVMLAVICIVLAALLWLSSRNSFNPDGISYLDMASNAVNKHPRHLFNSLWSPLYPALIALILAILKPLPSGELMTVHFLGWLLFSGATAAFTYFLWQWFHSGSHALLPGKTSDLLFKVFTAFAYALFFWNSKSVITFNNVTPDMCVAALVYLAAGLCCRLTRPGSGWKTALAFGAALGISYYAKAAMFPLSAILFACLFTWPPAGLSRRKVLLAALAFLVTCAPLAAVMSSLAGRPSLGETGRLNYAWHVNEITMFAGWTGEEAGSGVPAHPPRIIMEKPRVLEFNGPIEGTYPLWYDPYYWNQGIRMHFDLDQQIRTFKRNFLYLKIILRDMDRIWMGWLALAVTVLFSSRRLESPFLRRSWMLIWLPAAILMFSVVHLEGRYVDTIFVLFWLGAYALLIGRSPSKVQAVILTVVALALITPGLSALPSSVPLAFDEIAGGNQFRELVAAEEMVRLGIQPGDGVAFVGEPFWAIYVRLARARIVAQVMNPAEYWELDDSEASVIWRSIRRAGAKLLMANNMPKDCRQTGWQSLANTGIYVHMLGRPPASASMADIR